MHLRAGRRWPTACWKSLRYDAAERPLRPGLLHRHLAHPDLHRGRAGPRDRSSATPASACWASRRPGWRAGEDASFTSLRRPAHLGRGSTCPPPTLGFAGPRPLVYYVHGGPQGQERPDFAWFSMPLIQFLTLNGFAVFVPNVRGSTGYGLSYTKRVDHDWGGQDRLDHVHAMTQVLPQDPRLDVTRAPGWSGRSYGGYMTLTLATRHPELVGRRRRYVRPVRPDHASSSACPKPGSPTLLCAVGDPVTRPRLPARTLARAPTSTSHAPARCWSSRARTTRASSSRSRATWSSTCARAGKEVEYLVFEDEGHDVLKFANRVRCYNTITSFFAQHLHP